ncbi:MAG: ATP-binding protein [Puniceicoccales bacterium]|jgi:GTPase SAR1 family protein|nr:ATP-binding protein [Puniceicoccales bacterium]
MIESIYRLLITGTHGCGKSTLSHRICSELKKSGRNALVLSETARESPFPINKSQTENATFYIAMKQAVKELEAIAHGYAYLVLDRGMLDSFAYSEATRSHGASRLEKSLLATAIEWTNNYNKIIFLKNDLSVLDADGVRDTDLEFAMKIEKIFEKLLREIFLNKLTILSYSQARDSKISIDKSGDVILTT